jgi:hypothetical protein
MSEYTQCNHCTMQGIERRAKLAGKKVTVLADARWGMGGVNVYEWSSVATQVNRSSQLSRSWYSEAHTRCCYMSATANGSLWKGKEHTNEKRIEQIKPRA